jgi:hypothetical protein
MLVKVISLSFDSLGGFNDTELRDFLKDKEVGYFACAPIFR